MTEDQPGGVGVTGDDVRVPESQIRVLDAALADQIAAGEVVERPASVVKELLENAVDAGAKSIRVEILGGGSQEIRVTDDGAGMSPADARLCVVRHATSKIRALADLDRIGTLGFRGEALPSIASVCRFELTTRPRASVAGTRLRIDGGGPPDVQEIGCAPGTTVLVRELFYNVPARRKFLKARATESAKVAEACRLTALADPSLRISLMREGRRGPEWLPSGSREERARGTFRQPLSHVEGDRDGVFVEALLGAPEKARSGAGGLAIFVNGRPVQDRALARAVAFAYGSVLPAGRYPSGVVYLELDGTLVDVNVHPRKAEVRFAGGRAVLDAVTRVLAEGLGTSAWRGPASRPASYWGDRLGGGEGGSTPAAPPTVRESSATAWGDRSGAFDSGRGSAEEQIAQALGASSAEPASAPAARADAEAPERGRAHGPAGTAASAGPPDLLGERGFFSSLRVLGQAKRMLIVCEGPDGLHVIDQHAADERVRFDQLRAAHGAREVATQHLLIPERVAVTEEEHALVEEHGEALLALGLDASPLGAQTVAVRAVPTLVRRASPERLLRDVLVELERAGDRAFSDAVDMALATMACHGAIRAGDELSVEECRALLRAMDAVRDFGGHCPHGRPVIYSVGFGELERRLGR